jgi:hypothetical protein
MRASQWLLGLATTAATVACVAAGCGGNTSGGNSNDSGAADVTTDHVEAAVPEAAQEAAPEAASDSPPPCASDAQITSIMLPDGSVPGSDASAAACLSCVETDCPNIVMECNAVCGCPQAFETFEQCVNAGGNVMTCGEGLLTAGLTLTQVECALPCLSTCGVTLDASKETSSDSPSDVAAQ